MMTYLARCYVTSYDYTNIRRPILQLADRKELGVIITCVMEVMQSGDEAQQVFFPSAVKFPC
jgi:hypothetical protein